MASATQRLPLEWELELIDGGRQALSHYRGRVVVLQILSTRCSRCAAIVQMLNLLQREFGIQALALAVNADAREKIDEFVHHSGPEFPVAIDTKPNVCDLLGLPHDRPLFLPVIAFVDRTGTVRGLSCPGTDFFTRAETTFPAMVKKLAREECA
jgi:peroxiredoxin